MMPMRGIFFGRCCARAAPRHRRGRRAADERNELAPIHRVRPGCKLAIETQRKV